MDSRDQPHAASPSPNHSSEYPQERRAICPFCRSADTEPMSLFGSQLSTSQYYCRACHTPFERMKQESDRA
jgi:hypothetical protein